MTKKFLNLNESVKALEKVQAKRNFNSLSPLNQQKVKQGLKDSAEGKVTVRSIKHGYVPLMDIVVDTLAFLAGFSAGFYLAYTIFKVNGGL